MKNFIILFCIALTVISCGTANNNSTMKSDQKNGNTQVVSAPVVEKAFVRKNGAPTDQVELYLQRSIQDYFIKFCESAVSREALEAHLQTIDSPIKSVTLEVEFKEGSWDICDENFEQQSRIGEYVIIHRIVTE